MIRVRRETGYEHSLVNIRIASFEGNEIFSFKSFEVISCLTRKENGFGILGWKRLEMFKLWNGGKYEFILERIIEE